MLQTSQIKIESLTSAVSAWCYFGTEFRQVFRGLHAVLDMFTRSIVSILACYAAQLQLNLHYVQLPD